jgi:hypothetical protein
MAVNKNDVAETRHYADLILNALHAAKLPVDVSLSALGTAIVEICIKNKESRKGVQSLLFAMYESFIEG